MLHALGEKFAKFSQLPPFTGGPAEHAMFTLVVVVCIVAIIIIAVYAIKGIVAMWSQVCDIRKKAIDAKIKMAEQETERIRITGRR